MRNVGTAITGIAAALALALSAGHASAATMLTVGMGQGCTTSCFDDQGKFQQTWSGKDFNGPISIGQLLLDRGILGDMDGSNFRLSFALNGQELGSWGTFNMAGIGGDELNFWGEDFTWNPEDGDLVLILEIIPPPKEGAGGGGGGGGGFTVTTGGPGPSGETNLNDGLPGDQPDVAAGVPEPAAWALMFAGFGLTGATLRRRRLQTARI